MNTTRLQRYAALVAQKRTLQAELDEMNKKLAALERLCLEDMVEAASKRMTIEVPGEGSMTVFLHGVRTSKLRDGVDRPMLAAALKDTGEDWLVKEDYNKNKFDAWVRERMKEDGSLPPVIGNLVEVVDITRLRAVKAD